MCELIYKINLSVYKINLIKLSSLDRNQGFKAEGFLLLKNYYKVILLHYINCSN